jgi:type IV pilus assembly protein PilN
VDIININLLPKSILEKRKLEGLLKLLLLGAIVVLFAAVSVYGYNLVRIAQARNELAILKAENEAYEREISKIADFEKSKLVVDAHENLVNTAVGDKYSWSRMLNNISLIVPNEVWLTNFAVNKDGEITLSGLALSDGGQKVVAKWLVHLAEMRDTTDIWLTSSKREAPAGSPVGPTPATPDDPKTPEMMEFQTKLKIKSLQLEAPAPPAPGGQT